MSESYRSGRPAPLTVEERRSALPVPREILRRSGFDRFETHLAGLLRCAPDRMTARIAVAAQARRLWRAAVHRAQGHAHPGTLPAADDRPLYWARLRLTGLLRQWTPRFQLDEAERAQLIAVLEAASRGQDAVRYPTGFRRILVSGFDPFRLDGDIRRSNPSGAAALTLDGTTVPTRSGPARIRAMLFPVRWRPFELGMVEHALLPHLPEVDLFTTLSQGRRGQFDLERFNGRWHEGIDNENAARTGCTVPIPPEVPTVEPAPEFVPATLPYEEIGRAATGRFPVRDNTGVLEIPRGATEPVFRPDGPTPGSAARAGGGGGYLSNEIAYRATLLRDALGLDLPGGHVHTPILEFGPYNSGQLTDPVFERNQRDITAQLRSIITIAAGSIGRAPDQRRLRSG
ncbi:pyroglutamyl peptidase [Amycolatopsis aidingensis]|uniref:pyroglutamyl peptidase n=1 Tax=Amycolatopsis aidingensis TaxID=2842453 RepID=UPI001C0E4C58|nr:pyroglutamyl peptidase [Amycolatopsis aidingensis]